MIACVVAAGSRPRLLRTREVTRAALASVGMVDGGDESTAVGSGWVDVDRNLVDRVAPIGRVLAVLHEIPLPVMVFDADDPLTGDCDVGVVPVRAVRHQRNNLAAALVTRLVWDLRQERRGERILVAGDPATHLVEAGKFSGSVFVGHVRTPV